MKTTYKTNRYELINESPYCLMFTAYATDEAHVIELAEQAGFDIEGLSIELSATRPTDMMGEYYEPMIREE